MQGVEKKWQNTELVYTGYFYGLNMQMCEIQFFDHRT